ncbi:MAG: hypothetical protein H6909_01250 [Rickettsiaceae bacterium]|nr:hypothetical protein [Rickettsiaceae bacterium]
MSVNIETSDAILGEAGGWNEMTDYPNAADTQSGSYDYKNDFNEVRVVVEDFVSEPYNKIGPVKEESADENSTSVDENSTSNEVISHPLMTKEAMAKLHLMHKVYPDLRYLCITEADKANNNTLTPFCLVETKSGMRLVTQENADDMELALLKHEQFMDEQPGTEYYEARKAEAERTGRIIIWCQAIAMAPALLLSAAFYVVPILRDFSSNKA